MVLNLERWMKRIEGIPQAVRTAADAELENTAELMVGYLKQAAPTRNDISPARRGTAAAIKEAADLDTLRESIHWERATNRPLTVVVICDPLSPFGKEEMYAGFIEQGRKGGKDREPVPGRPFFWPIYRAYKKANRARVLRATLKAAKKEFGQ
jgi:hypothetical protein